MKFSYANTLQFLIQIHALFLLTEGNLASYVDVYTPDTAGFFEVLSLSLPGFMAMDGYASVASHGIHPLNHV